MGIDNFSVQPPTMAETISEPFFKGSTGRSSRGLLRLIILCLIAAAAVASRLFSAIRFESIIHEFDPWFSMASTTFGIGLTTEHGIHWDELQEEHCTPD